jgi:hypothetical protein
MEVIHVEIFNNLQNNEKDSNHIFIVDSASVLLSVERGR